ncbi:MAG: endonuclease/exonuclease/phosphatase family protein [Chloroflexota bacterium]
MNNRFTQLRRHWRRLLLPALIVLYLLFLVIYGLLWQLKADQLWQIDLMSNFTAWYFLPALPLLIIAVLLKRSRWALLLLIPLLAYAVKYGPRFLTRGVAASANETTQLTVMTMNMLKLNTDWEAVQAQIKAVNPDVLTLQEIPDAFLKDVWPALAATYPYTIHVYSPEEESNMGFLSRYPIIEQAAFYLPDDFHLIHIRAVIDVHEHHLVVYNLHLAAPAFERNTSPSRFIGRIFPYQYSAYYRRWQMGAFYPRLAQETLPVLVMGDFNTADTSGDYGRFKASSGLQDTFAEVGLGMGFTFPAQVTLKQRQLPFVPLMRLDYIWHNAQWQALSAWLGGPTGSDHLPVVAQLKLVP